MVAEDGTEEPGVAEAAPASREGQAPLEQLGQAGVVLLQQRGGAAQQLRLQLHLGLQRHREQLSDNQLHTEDRRVSHNPILV